MQNLRQKQRGFLLNPHRFKMDAPLKALYHFDGVDGATTTVDSSSYARAITLANSAQLDTTQAVFGVSSLLFTNASQSYASMAGSSDFNVGTDNFTIRFWVRKSANGSAGSYRRLFQTTMGDVVSGLSLADNKLSTGNLSWSISTNGTTQNIVADADVGSLPLNINTHISIEQSSGTIHLYVAGVRVHSANMGGIAPYFNLTYPWVLGGQTGTNRTLAGWIDEFEYYKGAALAGGAATYTLPIAPTPPP